MADNFVFENGDPIDVGSHGDTDYVYAAGDPVPNTGVSNFVFESGVGLDAGGGGGGGFAVEIDKTNTPVGETAFVSVKTLVTNNTDDTESGSVVLEIDGDVVDSEDITVPSNTTLTLYLEWDTQKGDAGSYTATVKSAIDSDSTGISVESVSDPDSKTYVVPSSTTLSDSQDGDYATGEITNGASNVRFVEATVSYEQKGDVFGGDQKGNWGLKHGSDTGTFDDYTVRKRFDQGGVYESTGRFDLQSVADGTITFAVDDGEGTIESA